MEIKQAKCLFFIVENAQKVYNVHITKKGDKIVSYADDFIANCAFDPDDYYAEHEYRARMGEWVTKDGTTLKIKNMETSHIQNCIRFINKTGDEALFEYLPVFKKELERRRTDGIQQA